MKCRCRPLAALSALLAQAACSSPPPSPATGNVDAGTSSGETWRPAIPSQGEAPGPTQDAGAELLDASPGTTPVEPGIPYGPHVEGSEPAEGSRVYPRELYDGGQGVGVAQRKRLVLRFSAAMDPAAGPPVLRTSAGGEAIPLSVEWSPDGRALVVTVAEDRDASRPPLDDEAAYRLELATLRTVGGEPLDSRHPYLGDGALDFSTGPHDELLEHTCFHTFYGPFTDLAATPTATGAPEVRRTHQQVNVTLPEGPGGHAGVTSLRSGHSGVRDFFLFLSHPVPVELRDETGALVRATAGTAAPACPGITAYVRFPLRGRTPYAAAFGPTPQSTVALLMEAAED